MEDNKLPFVSTSILTKTEIEGNHFTINISQVEDNANQHMQFHITCANKQTEGLVA